MTSPMPSSPSRLISLAPGSSRGRSDAPAGASQSFLRSSVGTMGSRTRPWSQNPRQPPLRDASWAPLAARSLRSTLFFPNKVKAVPEPRPADEGAQGSRVVLQPLPALDKNSPEHLPATQGQEKTRCLMSKIQAQRTQSQPEVFCRGFQPGSDPN